MLTMKRMVGRLSLAAGALALAVTAAYAATTSDQPAAVLIYPKIVFDRTTGTDTIIEIANTDTDPVDLHCFYVNATSHCANTGIACDSGLDCGGADCVTGWAETDFDVVVTMNQPFYWLAGAGRNRTCAQNMDCEGLPLIGIGVCDGGTPFCTTNGDCGVGGHCNLLGQSNAGTSVPPVPESVTFVGELKCVSVNSDGLPRLANNVYGTATIVTAFLPVAIPGSVDAQSYNAVGIRGRGTCSISGDFCDADGDCGMGGGVCDPPADDAVVDSRVLVLGTGPDAPFNSCAETLIVDHIFDGAPDPIANNGVFVSDLTLVPCSEDFRTGTANLGRSTAQFLVFNEFEQRFSTTEPVTCFDETLLSNVDTRSNTRSVFSFNVAGTIAGESRITAVGAGLIGVARVMKWPGDLDGIQDRLATGDLPPVFAPGAAYEVHQQGQRTGTDEIVLP